MSQPIVSVFGSSAPKPGSADYEAARTVGRLLAEAGFAVQTGGYVGVMAAASQGASEAGGHVIGVTSVQIEQYRPVGANQWVKEEIKHRSLRERVCYLVDHCVGAIVMPGGVGTLSELALMWSFVQTGETPARPIITVGQFWQRALANFVTDSYIKPQHAQLVTLVETPEQAVQALKATLAAQKAQGGEH